MKKERLTPLQNGGRERSRQAKFREKGPLLLFEQEMLFSDVVANGTSSWTPNAGIMPPHMQDDLEDTLNTENLDDIDVSTPVVNTHTPLEPSGDLTQPDDDHVQPDSGPSQPK